MAVSLLRICLADSGVYECEATNSMGTKKAKMNVAVQKHLKGVCC